VIPCILLIKFLFLSKNFIKERLEYFANSIKENYIGENNKEKTHIFNSLPLKNKEGRKEVNKNQFNNSLENNFEEKENIITKTVNKGASAP